MKLGRAELHQLQKSIDHNRTWSPVTPETKPAIRQIRQVKPGHSFKRPAPFDEPGIVVNEPLDAVGLGFDGLRPVFLVRNRNFIDILEIEDELLINPGEAKYKVTTATNRFIISRKGRSWMLEKQLNKASSEE